LLELEHPDAWVLNIMVQPKPTDCYWIKISLLLLLC